VVEAEEKLCSQLRSAWEFATPSAWRWKHCLRQQQIQLFPQRGSPEPLTTDWKPASSRESLTQAAPFVFVSAHAVSSTKRETKVAMKVSEG